MADENTQLFSSAAVLISATTLAIARSQDYETYALSFDYGSDIDKSWKRHGRSRRR